MVLCLGGVAATAAAAPATDHLSGPVAPALPAAGPAVSTASPGSGYPTAVHFGGLAAVGALFNAPVYQNGKLTTNTHYCSGSVVYSPHGDVVMTAAHCVYSKSGGYTKFLAFAPKYHNGPSSEGVWYVRRIIVPHGWLTSQNPNDDYAFLIMLPQKQAGRTTEIQQHTGYLTPTVSLPLPKTVAVTGYNDVRLDKLGNEPITCRTSAFEVAEAGSHYERFNCDNYQDGTSGSPWVVANTNHVIGVIGGYQQGGDSPNYSFSALFTSTTLADYHNAENLG
jgi:V8-like Glu-specific endopeptidase